MPPVPESAPELPYPLSSSIAPGETWPPNYYFPVSVPKPFYGRLPNPNEENFFVYGMITYRDYNGFEYKHWFCRIFGGEWFGFDDAAPELVRKQYNGYTETGSKTSKLWRAKS